MNSPWERLGEPAPSGLIEARLQLHHASLLAAAVGASLVEPRPDDSHPNLGWHPGLAALVGHPTPHEKSFRAGLRPADLHLLLLDAAHRPVAELDLDGRTRADALSWLASAIEAPRLELPGYEIPDHPVAHGAAFQRAPRQAFEELARWYANAAGCLEALVERTANAAPVRCWPHHFDIASLVSVAAGSDSEASRSIGIGLSPGDGSYAEPYWYVSPWPYPAEPELAPLAAGGSWHREGFLAAVLPASRVVEAGAADAQRERVEAFLGSALAACRSLLGA